MAETKARGTTQKWGYRQFTSVASAALLIFWWSVAFRVVPAAPVLIPLLHSNVRRDEGWLAFIAALLLLSCVFFLRDHFSPQSKTWLPRYSTIISSFVTTCGTAFLLFFPDSPVLLIVGGAVSAFGIIFLTIGILNSFSGVRQSDVILITVFSGLGLAALGAILLLLPKQVSIAATLLSPLLIGVFQQFPTHRSTIHRATAEQPTTQQAMTRQPNDQQPMMQQVDARMKPRVSEAEIITSNSRFRNKLLIYTSTLLFSLLYACITGFKADSFLPNAASSFTLTLLLTSGLFMALIMLAIQRVFRTELLSFIILFLVATALLLLPYSMDNENGYLLGACLNSISCTSCLILAGATVLSFNDAGRRALPVHTGRAFLVLAVYGGTSLLSAFFGSLIYRMMGEELGSVAIIAAVVLYMVFLVFGITANKRERVRHVLSGRFDNESDISDARSRIISLQNPSLTEREVEILSFLLRGRSALSIADSLIISENTVKTHIRHIYKKLNVNSRRELQRLADDIPLEEL